MNGHRTAQAFHWYRSKNSRLNTRPTFCS